MRVKSLVEALLLYSGARGAARLFLRPRALILAYHNIVPDEAQAVGDRSLHLRRTQFARQLDAMIAEGCEIVPLERMVDDLGESRRPRVAITFDDAYLGAVTIGVDELVRRGLPATIFVCPAFVGARSFWWDEVRLGGVDDRRDRLRSEAIVRLAGRDAWIREWALARGLGFRDVRTDMRPATEKELEAAAATGSITLASHSWSHPNLTALREGAELRDELVKPLRWLEQRFGPVIRWLAYPYGMSSASVRKAAAAAGYRGAVHINGGWISGAPADRYALPRLHVPEGLSLMGFRLRLAGLLCR